MDFLRKMFNVRFFFEKNVKVVTFCEYFHFFLVILMQNAKKFLLKMPGKMKIFGTLKKGHSFRIAYILHIFFAHIRIVLRIF